MINRFLLTSMCFISTLAYGQNESVSSDESSWKTLRRTSFEIQYPEYWVLDTTSASGPTFVLFGRQAMEMMFRENVNLIIQDLQGLNLDLKSFAEISEEQIASAFPNASLIESQQVSVGSDRYHLIVYAGDFAGHKLKWKQHYRIVNDKAYVLTFTGTQATYDAFMPVVDKIMNSFRVISN